MVRQNLGIVKYIFTLTVCTRFNVFWAVEYAHALIEDVPALLLATALFILIRRNSPIAFKSEIAIWALFLLTVLTHERFLALTPILVIAVALAYRGSSTKPLVRVARFVSFGAAAGVAVVLLQSHFSKHGFLTGTNKEPIQLGADTVLHLGIYLGQIAGFNFGDNWFVGTRNMIGLLDYGAAFLGFLPVVAACFFAVKGTLRACVKEARVPYLVPSLVFLAAVLLLLAVASITTRCELRWIYVPYVCVMSACLVTLNRCCSWRPCFWLGCLCFLLNNLYFLGGSSSVYTVRSAAYARALGDELQKSSFRGSSVSVIISTNDIWAIGATDSGKSFAQLNHLPESDVNTVLEGAAPEQWDLRERALLADSSAESAGTFKFVSLSPAEINLLKNPAQAFNRGHSADWSTRPLTEESDFTVIPNDKIQSLWHIDPTHLIASDGSRRLRTGPGTEPGNFAFQRHPLSDNRTIVVVARETAGPGRYATGRLQLSFFKGKSTLYNWSQVFEATGDYRLAVGVAVAPEGADSVEVYATPNDGNNVIDFEALDAFGFLAF